jgi:hypothetical protein
VPDFVSHDAVIVVLPTISAVTRPVGDIVATVGSLEVQLTARPVSTLLAESYAVAIACAVPPGYNEVVESDTCTDATVDGGPVVVVGVTVTVARPDLKPRAAVITADPALIPVTRPDESTVATPGSLEVQATLR